MATIPASNRRMVYSPVAATGPFPIDFPLFDETGADLRVTLGGGVVGGWVYTGTLEPGQYGEPNTWVNGSISFAAPITGALVIDGRRSPRRQSQYQEGRGVPARDQNTENNIHVATAQEFRRDIDDEGEARTAEVTRLDGRITDEIEQRQTDVAGIRTRLDGHDNTLAGHSATLADHEARLLPIPEILAARDEARSWAEQPYGEAVISDPAGRSALHWQEVAHQWATQASMLALLAGALVYDFNLPGELVGDEDWNNPT